MRALKHRGRIVLRAALILLCFWLVAFAQSEKRIPIHPSAKLIAELQKLLKAEVVAHASLPGELLHVQAPKQGD